MVLRFAAAFFCVSGRKPFGRMMQERGWGGALVSPPVLCSRSNIGSYKYVGGGLGGEGGREEGGVPRLRLRWFAVVVWVFSPI